MKTEMLKLKQINPLGKLILQLIFDETPTVYKWNNGYNMTAYDMAIILGTTRQAILDELWVLEEMGLIKSIVRDRQRITRITTRLTKLMKDGDNATKTVAKEKDLILS